MVFCRQWGHYLHERLWAKVQRHSSTCSGQNIKTMLLAKFVIISQMQGCFVNNEGIIFRSELVPSAKHTLAPVVVKILKQCYWQNLLLFKKCEGVLQTMGALSS